MSSLNHSGEESSEWPLCMEPLEMDDLSFYPCTCGYQVIFCIFSPHSKSETQVFNQCYWFGSRLMNYFWMQFRDLKQLILKMKQLIMWFCFLDMSILLAPDKDRWEWVVPCLSEGIPWKSSWFQTSFDSRDAPNQGWETSERPTKETESNRK